MEYCIGSHGIVFSILRRTQSKNRTAVSISIYTLDLNLQSFFFRSWIAYLPLRLVAEMFPFMWFSLYVILLDSWPFVRLHLFWASMMVGDDIMFIPFRCL